MENIPSSKRLHIGIIGACNSGKSTLINLLTQQDVSLVSDVVGTTTDPVKKSMELLPLGPVMLIDTAGIDDNSELGELRLLKTTQILMQLDVVVFVIPSYRKVLNVEIEWLEKLKERKIPVLLLINQFSDKVVKADDLYRDLEIYSLPILKVSIIDKKQRLVVLDFISKYAPKNRESSLFEGMDIGGKIVGLVCPIDDSAPKGRLILPQVQAIRDILDNHGICIVLQLDELPSFISKGQHFDLVVTDSQVFSEVNAILPREIPLTSFSILLARNKGELKNLVFGVQVLQQLKQGGKVLISEACTHRQQCEDIGTVKIPRWLRQAGYETLELHWSSGSTFPIDFHTYDLVIHCGGCMLTRTEMLNRLEVLRKQEIPIINYGVLIAFLHGILERALDPFKNELNI